MRYIKLVALFCITTLFIKAQNVGIGTATPNNKLEIKSNAVNSSGLRFSNLTSTSTTLAANGKCLSVDVNGDVILTPSAADAWSIFGNTGTTSGTNFLGTTDLQSLVFKTNNTEWMRLLTNGYLGIGTNTATHKIHAEETVNGDVGLKLWNPDNVGNNAREIVLIGQASGGRYGYLAHHNDGYNNGAYPNLSPNSTLLSAGDGNLLLSAGTATNDIIMGINAMNSQYVTIKGNTGNVGIGYPAAPHRLTVYNTRLDPGAFGNGVASFGGDDVFLEIGASPTPAINYPMWLQAKRISDNANFPILLNPQGGNVGVGTLPTSGALFSNGPSHPGDQSGIGTQSSRGMDWNATGFGYAAGFYNEGTVASSNGLLVKINDVTGNSKALTVNSGVLATGTDLLTVLGNGGVGIGTNMPQTKLNINNGQVRISNTFDNVYQTSQGANIYDCIGTYAGWDPNAIVIAGYNITNSAARQGNKVLFGGNGFERMIVDLVTGRTGIGTLAPTSLLSVNGTADKVGGGAWAVFSDKRVKKNIQDYSKGLEYILKINPVTFEYNGKGGYKEDGKTYVGVVAQEMENVLPSTVSKVKTSDFDDQRIFDASELTFTLINAVKELKQEINALKTENSELKASLQKVNDLEGKINFILKSSISKENNQVYSKQ